MTIHELLQAAGLTANDEIPIWDADGTGEPTKKITAQQLATAVVALANLVTGVKGNAETGGYRHGDVNLTPANIGAVAKTGDTMTGPLTTNSDIIQTSGRLKGQGDNYTNHALKLGHADDDVMQFFEYGGQFDFIKSMSGSNTTLFQIKDGVSAYPLPVNNGGTGATTPAAARTNLDVPSRTGAGASGTWGISVSGSAGSVAWGNVSGKPANYPGGCTGNAATATKATQDGYGNTITSTYAKVAKHNNLTASGNEFTFAASGQSGGMWFNYRTAGGANGNITEYIFGNGKGGSLASITSGTFSGNAANVTGTVAVGHGGTGGNDAATARTNLDVYSKSEVNNAIQQTTAYETKQLAHHAITAHSTGGAYYSATEVDVSKAGYVPVACFLYAWSNVNSTVTPYITSSNQLGFISPVSQTPNLLTVRILYQKSTQ